MAEGEASKEPDRSDITPTRNGHPKAGTTTSTYSREDGDEEDGEEEDEEEEPRLKYIPVSKRLSSLYRNGDAVSAFLVGGDKMIVGTHNGNIHALSLPSFQSLRVYHAHSASVSAVSISPFPPPLPIARSDAVNRLASATPNNSVRNSGSPGQKQSPKQVGVAATPSNSIYIGTASIDGNVCISSLVDPKDVQLRNFGRPVQAVALSPEYKYDRIYLSGGQAGSLVLTSGGQAGRSANANLGGAAAAAQGWLGAIGLGSSSGSDKVLHSGEGIISTIKWSLSGKYVLWVNEHGIKIMRSNLHLESADSGFEWKRLSHIDRPNRPAWDDMAGVWKARAEWIDRGNLETDDEPFSDAPKGNSSSAISFKAQFEEAVVGWGDTVWLIRIHAGGIGTGKEAGERKIGHAEVTNILRMDSTSTIAGVSLYTQNLLVVLAYTESGEDLSAKSKADTPTKKGRHHRHNALKPELQLININTKEEVSADTLTISRYESLSASDYHIGILPPMKLPASSQRGALGAISSGLETIGQGVWDVSLYSGRLFSSGGSILSGRNSDEKGSASKVSDVGSAKAANPTQQAKELLDVATSSGMKIFIYSPYDCIVALKRDLADRLQWLSQMGHYEQAWELLDQHPEAVDSNTEPSEVSSPTPPSKSGSFTGSQTKQTNSLADFFADASSLSSQSKKKNTYSMAEKEKRRIGELWLQQLVSKTDWVAAGEAASRVLNTSSRWEHWVLVFIRNNKFDEISPHIPTFEITPPLPSHLYDIILGHYLSSDRARFQQLLDLWPATLFDPSSILNDVEIQLQDPIATPKESSDWRILQECLAKLFVASGQSSEALRCYIRLQDADTALALIKDHHLLGDVADDIPGLILLRVSQSQLEHSSILELEALTSEPIALLVDEAHHGTVQPDQVVTQLKKSSLPLFLFFYLRALWLGHGANTSVDAQSTPKVGHSAATTTLVADEGKLLVEQFADTAVSLLATYDRPLLMDFLQTSTAYTFDTAVRICELKHYTSELVYLLAKTGQVKKALFLIIDELKDVVQAISFAKQQDDPDLWDDLLDYSMSRPTFIQGLLAEVGTAIDPIKLVKRIPSGLEVEGLRDGLKKMVREYDLQDSISMGVAKVLQGEVAVGMEALRKGRRRGIKFDVEAGGKKTRSRDLLVKEESEKVADSAVDGGVVVVGPKPGHCAGCGEPFGEYESHPLIGFACGHTYHSPHLLLLHPANHHGPCSPPTPPPEPSINDESADDFSSASAPFTRSVSAKVTNARLLKMKVDEVGGCRVCAGGRRMGKG